MDYKIPFQTYPALPKRDLVSPNDLADMSSMRNRTDDKTKRAPLTKRDPVPLPTVRDWKTKQ